jgi:hypothetical protein
MSVERRFVFGGFLLAAGLVAVGGAAADGGPGSMSPSRTPLLAVATAGSLAYSRSENLWCDSCRRRALRTAIVATGIAGCLLLLEALGGIDVTAFAGGIATVSGLTAGVLAVARGIATA